MAFITINEEEFNPASCKFEYETFDGENAGRTLDGTMHRDVIATKIGVQLEWNSILLKKQQAQAETILSNIQKLNGYKRFETTMPSGDFRIDPFDIVTFNKGEDEYIVPVLFSEYLLSYAGVGIKIQSPVDAPSKKEFGFKGTLTQKVENIYTQMIQAQEIIANKITVEELNATIAKIEELYVKYGEFEELVADSAIIGKLEADLIEVNKIIADFGQFGDLEAITATIELLKAKVAEIDSLIADSILSEIIQSGSISSDLLNVKDGFIKDAMISSLSASKIDSGIINTNNVSIQSEDGNMLLQGNLLQFKDKNGVVRIQIGKDTTGNYTFTLYDSTGKGVLINQDGIQSSNAIKDGLIVDANINDNANISGGKLDITSLYEHMNEDGSNTLKASKIYFDDKEQTLDVSFKEMTTKQDELEDTMQTAITDIEVSQGQISQLIQDTTITTSNGTTTLKDAYNHTKSTVDSHTTTIGNMQSTLNAQTGEIESMNSQMSKFSQNLQEIDMSVTKVEVITDELQKKSQSFEESIESLNNKLDNLDGTLEEAIKDGLISEAEANSIKQQIKLLDKDKADIDAQYSELYNNDYLS